MVSQGIENHIETTHCVLQCPHLPPPLSTVSLSSLPNRTGLFPVLPTQSATFHLQALALAVPYAWQAVPTPDCSSAQTVPSERGLPGHPTLRRPLMSAPLPWSLQSDYCMRASLQSLLCVSLFACLLSLLLEYQLLRAGPGLVCPRLQLPHLARHPAHRCAQYTRVERMRDLPDHLGA